MKSFIIALAASTALAGAAIAQTSAPQNPTATEAEQDATTVPAQEAAPPVSTDAPRSGVNPIAPESEQDATTVPAQQAAPAVATDAPAAGVDPSAPESEQDATTVEVGGAPMFSNRTIAENAPNATNLSTLVAATEAAGLLPTFQGPGPFTVFAPDNAAFEALPAGTVDTLLEPENSDQLTSILTYHVVPQALTSADLTDGASLTTVEGGTLTVATSGGTVTITDAAGNTATVTQADVLQSNGVVHVIDTVLMPAD